MSDWEFFRNIYDRINGPFGKDYTNDNAYQNLLKDVRRLEEELFGMPAVTEELRKSLDAVLDAYMELYAYKNADSFVDGVHLGGRLVISMMESPLPPME